MNERIRELAEQADLIEWEVLPWNSDCKTPDHESVAKAYKFAELLIDECCKALDNTERHRRDYFIAKIREHFEVK